MKYLLIFIAHLCYKREETDNTSHIKGEQSK